MATTPTIQVPSPYPDSIDSTLGGQYSNSYCDVAYADLYFSNHFNSTKSSSWAVLQDGQKIQALISACWTIEQYRFTVTSDLSSSAGSELQYNTVTGKFTAYVNLTQESAKYFAYQMLQFPRNKDIYPSSGLYIPDRIMKAQCEQAIYAVNFDDSAMSNIMQGITLDKISVGKGAVELTQQYSGGGGSTLAPLALDYIKPYLVYNSRILRA